MYSRSRSLEELRSAPFAVIVKYLKVNDDLPSLVKRYWITPSRFVAGENAHLGIRGIWLVARPRPDHDCFHFLVCIDPRQSRLLGRN